MPITAAVSAAGSIGGALISSNASKSASEAQANAAQQALQQQQAMFGEAKNALNPYVTAGQSVLPTLQGLLTPGTSANVLSQMPGFQFQSQYGTKAATNALAARGLGASAGPLATAISQYNNGLAGTTWQNVVGALQGFASTGANSANALASAATGAATTQGNTIQNIGNANASGILGSANALAGGLQGVSNIPTNALLLSKYLNGTNTSGLYSGASYGGGNVLTDEYGGSSDNPLSGLTAADYGTGF